MLKTVENKISYIDQTVFFFMLFLPDEDDICTTFISVDPDIGTWRQLLGGLVYPDEWLNQQAGGQLTANMPWAY